MNIVKYIWVSGKPRILGVSTTDEVSGIISGKVKKYGCWVVEEGALSTLYYDRDIYAECSRYIHRPYLEEAILTAWDEYDKMVEYGTCDDRSEILRRAETLEIIEGRLEVFVRVEQMQGGKWHVVGDIPVGEEDVADIISDIEHEITIDGHFIFNDDRGRGCSCSVNSGSIRCQVVRK